MQARANSFPACTFFGHRLRIPRHSLHTFGHKKLEQSARTAPALSERGDSNARPLRPERSALPTALLSDCAAKVCIVFGLTKLSAIFLRWGGARRWKRAFRVKPQKGGGHPTKRAPSVQRAPRRGKSRDRWVSTFCASVVAFAPSGRIIGGPCLTQGVARCARLPWAGSSLPLWGAP